MVEGPIARLLTWLQQVGETPVVNPTKQQWTVPDKKPSPWSSVGWFFYATFILLALVGYTIWFGAGPAEFIYAGF